MNHELLEALGVKSIGHRITILKSAAVFGSEAENAAADTLPAVEYPTPAGDAERRQLTVMFCDLVGSTALSESMDPEEYREVLAAYQSAAAGAIAHYEGYVARYMGDGLLVYFGYPQAHEDDAERAVRAGLGIVEAVDGLRPRGELRLQVRIGVATGLVVVGDIVGEGASEERAVLGDTPNLAARLQGVAPPNGVVIGENTQRLVAGLFVLDDLEPQSLKGISAQVTAYQAKGTSAAPSRFEAAHPQGVTPLTGRESELALLTQRWNQASEGEGQVVLLEGEPGIGKSRLLQAARDHIDEAAVFVQRYQCSPYHATTPFYPVIDLIERAARFSPEEGAEEKLDKLEAAIGSLLPSAEPGLSLMAALLSLPVDRYSPLNMTPQKQRLETIEALVAQLRALRSAGPLLMLFEDVHWSDPSTLEFLEAVIDRIESSPVLCLITFRPEFSPPWTGHGHVTTLSLNRLGVGLELTGQ